ncbi:hypothetical protein BG004_002124 [Podila humilis]|nr:hypothetical protein BG004_002124 [Podila humilis]
MLSDDTVVAARTSDMEVETESKSTEVENETIDGDYQDDNEIDMENDRESSDGSDVEDDEDQELRSNSAQKSNKQAHTSDRVQKAMTNPEIEAAFHDQYMTQVTQAFGDELMQLRETDSLDGPHLELLIDSLNQTGHIYRALNVQLEEWMGTSYEVHQYQLNLLYSAYSLPNVILPLVGGFLIDRLAASRMLILFSVCVCLGQSVFAVGVSFKSISVMVLGRLIFGIGGECLEVAQAKITTDWFKSRWLGFALGLNLSSARLGTALNDNVSPMITMTGGGVVAASWTGFVACVLSLACGFGLVYLDRSDSRRECAVRLDAKDRTQETVSSPKDNIIGRQSLNVSSDSTMTLSSEAMEEQEDVEKEIEMAEDDQILYSEIFTLQPNFWILCLCCILLYGKPMT